MFYRTAVIVEPMGLFILQHCSVQDVVGFGAFVDVRGGTFLSHNNTLRDCVLPVALFNGTEDSTIEVGLCLLEGEMIA